MKQCDKLVLRHSPRDQKSRALIATQVLQRLEFGCPLDSFPDGGAFETVRQFDYSFAQREVGLVAIAIRDKAAVDLQFGERQRLQPRERGVAVSDVVQRQLDAIDLQLDRDFEGMGQVVDDLILGDLENEILLRAGSRAIFSNDRGYRQF